MSQTLCSDHAGFLAWLTFHRNYGDPIVLVSGCGSGETCRDKSPLGGRLLSGSREEDLDCCQLQDLMGLSSRKLDSIKRFQDMSAHVQSVQSGEHWVWWGGRVGTP